MVSSTNFFVMPAKAGIQRYAHGADMILIAADAAIRWIPAFAGMTARGA